MIKTVGTMMGIMFSVVIWVFLAVALLFFYDKLNLCPFAERLSVNRS